MKRLYFALLALMLTGCVSKDVPLESVQSNRLDTWHMKGRLAAVVDQQGGSASFIWQRRHDEHNIELYGPLGSGRILLNETNQQASLTDKDSVVQGANLQDVLYEYVGWLVPFKAINHWVTGSPDPDFEVNHELYEAGKLVGFEQMGWLVDYQAFKSYNGTVLPAKIRILATQDYLVELSQELYKTVHKVSVKLVIREFSR